MGQYLLSGLRFWDSGTLALLSTIATFCSIRLGHHADSQKTFLIASTCQRRRLRQQSFVIHRTSHSSRFYCSRYGLRYRHRPEGKNQSMRVQLWPCAFFELLEWRRHLQGPRTVWQLLLTRGCGFAVGGLWRWVVETLFGSLQDWQGFGTPWRIVKPSYFLMACLIEA